MHSNALRVESTLRGLFLLLQGPEVLVWETTQDPFVVSALNKTIPVVAVLEDGSTVHLVGEKRVNMWDLSVKDLMCPTKSTTEIILTVKELDAVESMEPYNGCINIKECVLFLNGYNTREVKGTNIRGEAKACQVGFLMFSSVLLQHSHACVLFLDTCVVCWLCVLQRQAKRRKIMLTEGGTMMDLYKKNMDLVEAPMCRMVKKNAQGGNTQCNARCAMGLLTCANHMGVSTWGEVPL